MKTNHTFAICAYKESEYLEECIQSVQNQTIPTNIIMVTSTPNAFLDAMAEKYKIPLYVNEGEKGITQDWNFAYACADTEYVTITHQDDVYGKEYVENLLQMLQYADKPLIFFTDYGEMRNGKIVTQNKLLKIKRVMLFPLRFRIFWKSRFVRRRMLSLGSAICCPSVTFVKSNLPKVVFQHGYRAAEDWQAWERLSRIKGEFLFCNKILMYHRIHKDSETTKILQDKQRRMEDFEMFSCFWPKPIARFLTKVYGTSEYSNDL